MKPTSIKVTTYSQGVGPLSELGGVEFVIWPVGSGRVYMIKGSKPAVFEPPLRPGAWQRPRKVIEPARIVLLDMHESVRHLPTYERFKLVDPGDPVEVFDWSVGVCEGEGAEAVAMVCEGKAA